MRSAALAGGAWDFGELALPDRGRLLFLHRLKKAGWELVGFHASHSRDGRAVAVVRRRRTRLTNR